ncbi:Ig-like domain-containing protein [Nitratireductor sp. XY-223]|uniref:Ig-like domain-containing protein n=1 Tax=Nitratireductor sp. XY-223 TaxID=2561926 RepID=UPI0010A9DE6B|nr:Ig-like domain-containing protein [Nitratireductor sp. XY-223]
MVRLFRLLMCLIVFAGTSTFAHALQIPAGIAETNAGVPNAESLVFTLNDGVAPGLASTSIPSDFDGPDAFVIELVFDEVVTDFDAGDLVLANADVVEFAGSGTIYTISIDPIDALEDITITLPADAVMDGNNNGNAEFSATVTANPSDTTGPIATIDVPDTYKLQEPFTATITFNENVVGFTLDDLEVSEAAASNFTVVSASEYTVDITTDGIDTIGLALPADTFEDAYGNGNERAEATIGNAGNVEETLEANAAFMSMRGRRIMSDRPDYKAIALRGTKPSGAYSFAYGTDGLTGLLNVFKGQNFNERWFGWTQLTSSITKSRDNELQFAMLIGGIQRSMNDNLTLGLTGQIDYSYLRNDSAGSRVKGVGWMIGPYLVYRVPEQNLTFELETSWGRSTNDTNPVGLYVDEFKTDRFLIAGEVSVDLFYGGWTVSPSLGVSYFRETQHSYVDTIGFTIPEQTVSLGDVIFGFDFMRDWLLDNGSTIALNLGLAGAYAFEANTGGATDLFSENALRPKINADIRWSYGDWIIDFSVFQEGLGMDPIGASGAEATSTWGAKAAVGAKF